MGAREGVAALAIVVAGGLIEGLSLGGFQAAGLVRRLPGLSRHRWIVVTTLVAGLGWAAASAPAAMSGPGDGSGPPVVLVLAGAACLGVAMGAVLGAAQASALRPVVRHPRRWIGAGATAWAPAMMIIFFGATVPGQDWSVAAVVLIGTATGLVAGATLGLVTWWFLPTLDGAPLHNRIVLGLLASRAHRVVDTSLATLRVTGTVSGRRFDLPVQYALGDQELIVLPARPETKQWWRNLRDPSPVDVLVQGHWAPGIGRALRPGDRGYGTGSAAYRTRWPRVRIGAADPIVVISVDPARSESPVGAAKGG